MNYLIQRGRVRQQSINVPEGLPELLSDITREVLRCQPSKECLCQFIIDYLHSVIVTREKAMVAKSILNRALQKVDEIIMDMCVCDLTKEKSSMMAKVMEDCFRNFLERRRCEKRRGNEIVSFDDLDLLEELIDKCHFTGDDIAKSRPIIENAYKRFVEAYMAAAEGTEGTELLYQYFRDRELKRIQENIRKQSAVKIQAAFRGYRVRKYLQDFVCTCTCEEPPPVNEKEDAAARVIQSFFRHNRDKLSKMSQITTGSCDNETLQNEAGVIKEMSDLDNTDQSSEMQFKIKSDPLVTAVDAAQREEDEIAEPLVSSKPASSELESEVASPIKEEPAEEPPADAEQATEEAPTEA